MYQYCYIRDILEERFFLLKSRERSKLNVNNAVEDLAFLRRIYFVLYPLHTPIIFIQSLPEKDCDVNKFEFYFYIELIEIESCLFHYSPLLFTPIPLFFCALFFPLLPSILCSSSPTPPLSICHLTLLLIFLRPCHQGVATLSYK